MTFSRNSLAVLLILVAAIPSAARGQTPPADAKPAAAATVATTPAPAEDPMRPIVSMDKGFSVKTADGRFGIAIGGWAHLAWTGLFWDGPQATEWVQKSFADTAADGTPVKSYFEKNVTKFSDEFAQNEFKLRRARVAIKGTMFKDLSATILMDLVMTPYPFLDYYLDWQPLPEIGIRAGQFLTPVGRYGILAPWVESSVTSAPPRTEFYTDRDVGIALRGSIKNRMFEYAVGVFNGTAKANKQDNTDVMVAGRLSSHPLGPMPDYEGDYAYSEKPLLSFGVSGAFNPMEKEYYVARADKRGSDKVTVHTKAALAVGDLSFAYKGFFITSEVWYRMLWLDDAHKVAGIDPDGDGRSDGLGWFVQSSYFVWKKRIELLGRVSMNRSVTEITGADKWEGLGGVNFYPFGYNWQIQTEYAYLRNASPTAADASGHQMRVQMLFKF